MKCKIIAAFGNNRVIGKDNTIPWYLPNDFKWFKQHTLNKYIVMGRKCYESIGRPLPNRVNIVISRQPNLIIPGCYVFSSPFNAAKFLYQMRVDEFFVIGGGELYQQCMSITEELIITYVDCDVEGDVFFPVIDDKIWRIKSVEEHFKDDKHKYDYKFVIYDRGENP